MGNTIGACTLWLFRCHSCREVAAQVSNIGDQVITIFYDSNQGQNVILGLRGEWLSAKDGKPLTQRVVHGFTYVGHLRKQSLLDPRWDKHQALGGWFVSSRRNWAPRGTRTRLCFAPLF